MKIIKPYTELINEKDPRKKIEICGRICYKSEDKITDDSASKFVSNIVKRGHDSVLEHVNFVMTGGQYFYEDIRWIKIMADRLLSERGAVFNKQMFSALRELRETPTTLIGNTEGYKRYIVSGNARTMRDIMRVCIKLGQKFPFEVLLEKEPWLFEGLDCTKQELFASNGCRLIDEADLTEENGFTHSQIMIHRTQTVRFVVDRGISHELVRHRKHSFSQESSRYCNYSNDKFGNEITFIEPCFFPDYKLCEEDSQIRRRSLWKMAMEDAERAYFKLLSHGAKPEEARDVLPMSTKTELAMSSNLAMWKHFFGLRCSDAAHPQMREVAIPLRDKFITEIYGNM